MNTSALISIGSRPLLPAAKTTYTVEPKEALLAKLSASVLDPVPQPTRYDTYQFEFPGDATYLRYLNSVRGQ